MKRTICVGCFNVVKGNRCECGAKIYFVLRLRFSRG